MKAACDDEGLETKSTDLGLLFGGGLGWEFSSGLLVVDVRYELGLTNLDDSFGVSDSSFEVKNRVWQISAGYRFVLGGD